MPRQPSDEVVANIASGSFLTTDTFRRAAGSVCNKIHESGWSISLGSSSDRPMYLVEDIDFADADDYEDATSVDLDEVRRSASWNAMAALMIANDQRFIVENEDGDRLVGIRIHPDFDRAEVKRMKTKGQQTMRDRRTERIESGVQRIENLLQRLDERIA